VAADLVLISSQLLDEGAVEGVIAANLRAGIYQFNGMQGIATNHDRQGGRRFEPMWLGAGLKGINILHLGSRCTNE